MNRVMEKKLSDEETIAEGFSVGEAVRRRDWKLLRKLSLRPGGFGKERFSAWLFLVNANGAIDDDPDDPKLPKHGEAGEEHDDDSDPEFMHPDEHQIRLDTNRSFVLYPSEEQRDRAELQSDLNDLITTVFRKHPRLNYFQGYHDIVTVIYLTLPEPHRLRVCEKLSLHRLRDAMGTGLEPVIAQLRILKLLLRLADKPFSELLESNTPLPYYALSNLLTLFSHDVPTLPLIQHIFDYLLCRPPIISVYLVAAITLVRKDEALILEEEGEDGMLHSLLSSLPYFSDERSTNISEDTSDAEVEGTDTILNNLSSTGCDEVTLENDSLLVTATNESTNQDTDANEGFTEKPALIQHSEDEQRQCINAEKLEVSLNDNEDLGDRIKVDERAASTSPGDSPPRAQRKTTYLPQILEQADELFTRYPPTHPDLHVSSILGPRSVVFTWSEIQDELLGDEEAEAIVSQPEFVVLAYRDPEETDRRKEHDRGESVSALKPPRKTPLHLGSRTLLLTGVAVAGVAVAVYSLKTRGGVRGRVDDLKKAGQWLTELLNTQIHPF
ncbi:hypothetical protein SCHPADRAFT_885554 [Schizopora paradoxa]|uniref:Rab-GAP TBC domain-containing protein n=1 Tax=Schizopora paradoxa TaxID=27342 RepID=A0A0H2SCH1_9AGAM|nr:hypothetical protein SCHPADRAFT_885554 [Schizopora paradoxa]